MENKQQSVNTIATRWHEAAYWGLMLVICILFYVMNCWTSFKEDDMEFSLLHDAGFMDFLRAQYDHYMTSNGRCADFFATLFCAYLGKPLFNVVNTLMFAAMVHLVSLLSTSRRSVLVLAMFIAYVGLWFPVPGQTMLFVAGSCNYMWAIVASLLMVYLLRKYSRQTHLGKGKTILLILLAFIAGNFNVLPVQPHRSQPHCCVSVAVIFGWSYCHCGVTCRLATGLLQRGRRFKLQGAADESRLHLHHDDDTHRCANTCHIGWICDVIEKIHSTSAPVPLDLCLALPHVADDCTGLLI